MPLSTVMPKRTYRIHQLPDDPATSARLLLAFPHALNSAWRLGDLLLINTSYTDDYQNRHQEMAVILVKDQPDTEHIRGVLFESITLTVVTAANLEAFLREYLTFGKNGLPKKYAAWSEEILVAGSPVVR